MSQFLSCFYILRKILKRPLMLPLLPQKGTILGHLGFSLVEGIKDQHLSGIHGYLQWCFGAGELGDLSRLLPVQLSGLPI